MLLSKEDYIIHGQRNAELRPQIEAIADKVVAEGFENVFFAGSGGSICMLLSFARAMKQLSNVPIYTEESAELAVARYRQFNSKSLVILVSKTGNAQEAITLVERCNAEGITTMAFVGNQTSPVYLQAKYSFGYDEQINELRYLPIYTFIFSLLHKLGDFPDYPAFCACMDQLPGAVYDAVMLLSPTIGKFANRSHAEPFHLYIASGYGYGEAFRVSACTIEEVFHIKTQAMNSAEFFHGCFEIVTPDTCVVLLIGEDENREVDLRVKRFIDTYGGDNKLVIDFKTLPMPSIEERFRPYFMPIFANAILGGEQSRYMNKETGLSHATRRYYRIVPY